MWWLLICVSVAKSLPSWASSFFRLDLIKEEMDLTRGRRAFGQRKHPVGTHCAFGELPGARRSSRGQCRTGERRAMRRALRGRL